MQQYNYLATIEHEKNGDVVLQLMDWQNCFTVAETLAEAVESLQAITEDMALYYKETGLEIPVPEHHAVGSTEVVEVNVSF